MYSNARNWKWMVPAGGFGFLLLLTRMFLASPHEWVRWMAFPLGMVTAVCAIASVANFVDYRRAQAVEMLERKKSAMVTSQLARELEAARGVSPKVVELLMNEHNRAWMLRGGLLKSSDLRLDVLYEAPDVTASFLLFVLQSSTNAMVMPKRLLVEGRKNRFDPHGAVTEYAMYDKLMMVLEKHGKVMRYSEFENHQWVEPWTPALVAEDYGFVLEEEVVGSDQLSVNSVQ